MLIKLNYCDFLLCRKTYDNCVKTILTSNIQAQSQSDVRSHVDRQTDRRADRHIDTHVRCHSLRLFGILSHVRHFGVCQSASQLSINSIEFLVIQSSFNRRAHKRLNHTKIVQLFQWIIIIDDDDDHEWMGFHLSKTYEYLAICAGIRKHSSA